MLHLAPKIRPSLSEFPKRCKDQTWQVTYVTWHPHLDQKLPGKNPCYKGTRWWFHFFLEIFTPTWGRFPFWRGWFNHQPGNLGHVFLVHRQVDLWQIGWSTSGENPSTGNRSFEKQLELYRFVVFLSRWWFETFFFKFSYPTWRMIQFDKYFGQMGGSTTE